MHKRTEDRGKTKLSKYHEIFIAACINNKLEIVEKILPRLDIHVIEQMIEKNNYNIFSLVAIKGYLSVMNKLIDLIADPIKRDQMIHGRRNANDVTIYYQPENGLFYAATINRHLGVVNRLIELTPVPKERDKMLSLITPDVLKCIARSGDLEMSQYLLSFKPESKPAILEYAKNEEFKQCIQDSERVIQKLIKLRKENGEHSIMKFFDYFKYGKNVFNIILTGKTFITYLQNLGIFDPLLDYIGDQDVSLTRKEKVWVLNALANHVPNLEDTRNPQDKKVSFVERVLAQKAAGQGRSLN